MTDVQTENYSIKSFMQAFSISRNTFYEEIHSGRLQIFKYKRRTYVTRDSAKKWLITVEEMGGNKILLPIRKKKPN